MNGFIFELNFSAGTPVAAGSGTRCRGWCSINVTPIPSRVSNNPIQHYKAIILKVENKHATWMNKCLLWVCQSIYLFSFTYVFRYLFLGFINQLRQGFPIHMDSSVQHPSKETITHCINYFQILPVSWTCFWRFVWGASPGGCPDGLWCSMFRLQDCFSPQDHLLDPHQEDRNSWN